MPWPPKANWPPRDWYDWSMLTIGVAAFFTMMFAAWRLVQ